MYVSVRWQSTACVRRALAECASGNGIIPGTDSGGLIHVHWRERAQIVAPLPTDRILMKAGYG
jgi:hypothetical protein